MKEHLLELVERVEDRASLDIYTDAEECQGQIDQLQNAIAELARAIRSLEVV